MAAFLFLHQCFQGYWILKERAWIFIRALFYLCFPSLAIYLEHICKIPDQLIKWRPFCFIASVVS
jgi:hypothetical protein